MPKIEVEVSFTKRVETTFSGVVEIDVPQNVIDDEGITDWLSEKYDNDHELAKQIDDEVSEDDGSEETDWEYAEAVEV